MNLSADPLRAREGGLPPILLFDVDGVLTDQHAKVDPRVVGRIASLASRGVGLAFVSGRSRAAMRAMVLRPLERLGSPLDAVVGACEYGAIVGVGSDPGRWPVVGPVLDQRVRADLRAASRRFRGLLRWDRTKECIATVEVVHGGSREDPVADALAEFAAAARVLAGSGAAVHSSSFAVDILPAGLGKRQATHEAIARLGELDRSRQVLAFGDTPPDVEIAEAAHDAGFVDVLMVAVARAIPEGSTSLPIVRPDSEFAAGTLEVLAQMDRDGRNGLTQPSDPD